MSAITFRKGNPISRRTLRFLLVCQVIGSPSRSRIRSQVRYSADPHGTLPRRRHDSAITRRRSLSRSSAPAGYLLIEYLRIDSVIESLSLLAPRTISRLDLYTGATARANKRTTSKPPCIHREILLANGGASEEPVGR